MFIFTKYLFKFSHLNSQCDIAFCNEQKIDIFFNYLMKKMFKLKKKMRINIRFSIKF